MDDDSRNGQLHDLGRCIRRVLGHPRADFVSAYQTALALFVVGSDVHLRPLPQTWEFSSPGRLFQGLGGGLLTALAYTTISRVFPASLHTYEQSPRYPRSGALPLWAVRLLGGILGRMGPLALGILG